MKNNNRKFDAEEEIEKLQLTINKLNDELQLQAKNNEILTDVMAQLYTSMEQLYNIVEERQKIIIDDMNAKLTNNEKQIIELQNTMNKMKLDIVANKNTNNVIMTKLNKEIDNNKRINVLLAKISKK